VSPISANAPRAADLTFIALPAPDGASKPAALSAGPAGEAVHPASSSPRANAATCERPLTARSPFFHEIACKKPESE